MAFTYGGNPGASDKDWIRFRLQDTTPPGLFQDEEIAAVLAETGDKRLAAVELAEAIARRFALQASYAVEGLREELTQRAELYTRIAADLRQKVTRSKALPVSTADASLPPAFRRGLHEIGGTEP